MTDEPFLSLLKPKRNKVLMMFLKGSVIIFEDYFFKLLSLIITLSILPWDIEPSSILPCVSFHL